MNQSELIKAVEILKLYDIKYHKDMENAIALAIRFLQQYLDIKAFPEEKTLDGCKSSFDVEKVNAFNEALHLCKLAIVAEAYRGLFMRGNP